MKTFEELYEAFTLFHNLNIGQDNLFIFTENGEVFISFVCSDFFAWGTADSEIVEYEDLPLLKECYNICKQLCPIGHIYTTDLFCAKKRKDRPMDCCFDNIYPGLHQEFFKCGPIRSMDIFNHPSKKYPKEYFQQ